VVEFASKGKYQIDGRGVVYVVTCPEYVPDRSRNPWRGQIVLIDGRKCTVIGVESYALKHIKKGAPIGLLVEEVD